MIAFFCCVINVFVQFEIDSKVMDLRIISHFSSIYVNHEFLKGLQNDPLLVSAGSVGLGHIGAVVIGPIGLIAGTVLGAAAAVIACIAIRYIFKAVESYKDQQFLSTFASDPRLSLPVKVSIEKIKKFILKSPIFVSQAFELHEIHNQLIAASRAIAEKNELQKEWVKFLQRLNGRNVHYPDGSVHPIETDLAIKAARKLKVDFCVQPLTLHPPYAKAEIEQIYQLEAECFTTSSRYTLEEFTSELMSPLSFCYLAKDKSSDKLLGLVWGRWEMDSSSNPFLHVCGLARKPSAAKLGIAEALMTALQYYQEAAALPCVLEVRESNTKALHLYQKWGYERVREVPHYYKNPDESAYLLRRSFVAARVA